MSSKQDTAFRVNCYAGYRGEQEPREFCLEGHAVSVLEVLERWIEPGYRGFKCRGSNGSTCILRHDAATDQWNLEVLAAGQQR